MKKKNPAKRLLLIIALLLWLVKIQHGNLHISTDFNDCISLHSLFGLSGNMLLYYPLFAFLIFGWMLYSMLTKWRPAVIKVRRLAFAPVMFLILTAPSLLHGKYHDFALITYCVGIFGVFALAMFLHGKIEIQADKAKGLIAIPADPMIIVATLVIMFNSFVGSYLFAINSLLLQNGWLLPAMAFMSGAIAGHRIAKSLGLYLKYRVAPHTDLNLTQ